ncbi:MAG TPA: S8 family serine peptidase, partial [Oligoflexia bacterium]|nr:S8 family serine peptidase [Oligoflexia bacterium]
IAAKVFGTSGYSDYATITEAVAYCNSVGADVINMSLGGGSVYPPLVEEIQHAIKQGTVVVLAAGNSGRGEEHDPKDPIDNVAFPGSIPEVLTVSASDALNRFAEFSSEGPRIDIMAPGTFSFTWISTGYWPTYEDKGIYSSIAGGATVGSSYDGDDDKIDGKRRFGRMSGTSMAAPHVAGAAALLKGLNNSASSEQVSDALIESAQRISGQPTNRQGAGLLDVQAAYELLKN